MSKMIFVNLPVTNLAKSRAFYEAIGFANNPQFSDDTSSCMVRTDAINVMLMTHEKWRTFTSRPISPAARLKNSIGWASVTAFSCPMAAVP